MKKTIKKFLFILLLSISLFNIGTTSYSAATMEYTAGYDVELHSIPDEEDLERPFERI